MTNKKRLRKNLKRFSNSTEQPLKFYSGALGIFIGGRQYVDVPNRPGFVYVRLRNNISELIQAHNQLVSPVYDLPVLVVRGNNYYEIYSRDTQQYTSYWDTQSSFLPRHGFQHEFDPANNGGGDLVFVHGEQFYPLMGFPSGTDGAGNILIAPYRYYANSAWHYAGDTGTSNLLAHRPTGSANAKLLLIGLTVDTGNPFIKVGDEFSAGITGAAALTQYVPASIDVNEEIPGTIVRLVTGTASITWANIYDARQYMGILQAGSNTFLNLSDTPDSYSGQANKVVVVKPDESGLEFIPTATGSAGASFDSLQEIFFPVTTPSTYTGSSFHVGSPYVPYSGTYYQLNFVQGAGSVNSNTLIVGDDQPALIFATNSDYDLKEWLLRGEYTLLMNLARSTGSHPMTAYAQLLYHYGGITEESVAISSLAENYLGNTAIVDTEDGPLPYAFRMTLNDDPNAMENGPIRRLGSSSPERLIVKVYVNAASGGANGTLRFSSSDGNFFSVNLQRQILDNHYFPLSGTFLGLSDTPNSYAAQANKFVAVNAGATGLEFVNSPSGAGGSGIVIFDDSVYKVTGSVISFDRNLSVAVTGTTAFVSTNDKQLDYVQITGSVSITATTEGTAETVITGNSINVDGSTRIMVEFYCARIQPSPAAANRFIVILLFDGATVLGQLALLRTPATGNDDKSVLARTFSTPSAGAHQYIIKAFVSAGTGSIFTGNGGAGDSLLPAYIRVVEAQAFS